MEKFIFEVEEYVVHVHADDAEGIHALNEAKKAEKLVGQYTMRVDSAHAPAGQKHVHVYIKRKQQFAMNADGTAHDKSHGMQLSNNVANGLRQRLPDFKIPPYNFIEAYTSTDRLLEIIDEALKEEK